MPTHNILTADGFFLGDVANPMMFHVDANTFTTFSSTADEDNEPYMALKPLDWSFMLYIRGHMTAKKFKKKLMSYGISRNDAERAVKTIQSYDGQRSYFTEYVMLITRGTLGWRSEYINGTV